MCILCQLHSVFTTFGLTNLPSQRHACTLQTLAITNQSQLHIFKNQPSVKKLQAIRRVVPSALLQNEVLLLEGEERRRALLKVAGMSAEKTIGPAE